MVDGGQLITPGQSSVPPPVPAKIGNPASPEDSQGHGAEVQKNDDEAQNPANSETHKQNPDAQQKGRKLPSWAWWAIGWVAFLILAFGGVYVASLFQKEEPTASENHTPPTPIAVVNIPAPTTSASLISDIPPLYPGLDWEATESGEFEFTNELGNKLILSGFYSRVTNLNLSPDDFIGYYSEILEISGWQENLNVASTGLGGGYFGYYKGNKYFEYGIFPSSGEPDNDFETYMAEIKYTVTE